MITALIATLFASTTLSADIKPTVCPIMGSPANMAGTRVDFAGYRVAFCCGGCSGAFAKEPAKALASDRVKGKIAGTFLFDPVSGRRVDTDKGTSFVKEHEGMRYFFTSKENMSAFAATPAKYTKRAKQEVLKCPVSGEDIGSYSNSGGYADYKDIRYFFCCGSCIGEFGKDPAKFTGKAGKPSAPQAIVVKGDGKPSPDHDHSEAKAACCTEGAKCCSPAMACCG